MSGRELHWKSGSNAYAVRIEESKDGVGMLYVGDLATPFTIQDRSASGGWIAIEGHNYLYYVHRNRNEYSIWIGGHTYRLERVEKDLPADQSSGSGSGEVRSMMPGKILRVEVAVGDAVSERQPVIVMESMKMENTLHATRSGIVSAVHCQPGQTVEMGEVLLVIEVQSS